MRSRFVVLGFFNLPFFTTCITTTFTTCITTIITTLTTFTIPSSRRKEVQGHLRKDEAIVSMTMFPLLGVGEFTIPHDTANSITRSLFVPDVVINPHPRFGYCRAPLAAQTHIFFFSFLSHFFHFPFPLSFVFLYLFSISTLLSVSLFLPNSVRVFVCAIVSLHLRLYHAHFHL